MKKQVIIIIALVIAALAVLALSFSSETSEENIPCVNDGDCGTGYSCENENCVPLAQPFLVDGSCIEEGDTFKQSENFSCCDGLEYTLDKKYYQGENCELTAPNVEGYELNYVCTNCGNSVCEEWENACNCAEDCS